MSDSSVGAIPGEVTEAVAAERKRPEEIKLPPREWMKENLFSSIFNTILTIVFAFAALWLAKELLHFVFSRTAAGDGTATNMRLFMTYTYPTEQYVRVWFSLGLVLSLAGLSAAAWGIGSQVTIRSIGRRLLMIGIAIALMGVGWVPILGWLSPFSSSARIAYLLVGAGIALVGLAGMRLVSEDVTVSSLLVFIVALRSGGRIALGGPVRAPRSAGRRGHRRIRDRGLDHQGSVDGDGHLDDRLVLRGPLPGGIIGSRLRTLLGLMWLASPLVVVFFVLRDPEFDYGHILTVEIPLFLAHAILGGLVLYWLTKPGLGEIGRVVAALMFLGAVATFFWSMLQVIRLTSLLLAVFAAGRSQLRRGPGERDGPTCGPGESSSV